MNRIIKHYLELLPDKPYLYLQYYKNFHCLPNLKNPKSFCEKIMWLKLHDKTHCTQRLLINTLSKIMWPR